MYNRSKIAFVFLFFLTCLSLYAQQSEIDSLENQLKSATSDTARLRLYDELCSVCETKDKLKYALPAIETAGRLLPSIQSGKIELIVRDRMREAYHCAYTYYKDIDSTKLLDFFNNQKEIEIQRKNDYGVLVCIDNISSFYLEKSDTSSYIKTKKDEIELFQRMKFIEGAIDGNLNLSRFYHNQFNMPLAIDFLEKATVLAENQKNNKKEIECLSTLVEYYREAGEYEQAKVNIEKCMAKVIELNDTHMIAFYYNASGVVLGKLHDVKNAADYFYKSLNLFRKINADSVMLNIGYTALARMYLENKRYDSAIVNFKTALIYTPDWGNNSLYRNVYNDLGKAFRIKGEIDSALCYHYYALKLVREDNDDLQIAYVQRELALDYFLKRNYIKAKCHMEYYLNRDSSISSPFLLEGLQAAYQIDSATGNVAGAWEHYKRYTSLKEKKYNNEMKIVAVREKAQAAYNHQKALDKAEQEKRDVKQRNIRNSILVGLGGMVLFSVVIYRQRNKTLKEKKRSDALLLNILPAETARELKEKGESQAKSYDEVTVMFTDFKDFTQASERLSPTDLVREINHCYSAFDKIIEKHCLEKIKTIGDSYMCVGGLPVPNTTHAEDVINAAIEISDFISAYVSNSLRKDSAISGIRIGINTGSVVAGIVGIKKFAYDIWGDTVNTAARMQQHGEPGKINISGTTRDLIKHRFHCTHRGRIEVKHKGFVDMYFVEGRK